MTDIYVAEEHSPLYDLWVKSGAKNLSLCHVDFHCDMRGLLIDRNHGKARYVWQSDPFMNRLDSGSFLAHAVMKGLVTSIRWVHDDYGGRKFDDLYCVKYETDFTALPFLFTGSRNWMPLIFTEQTFADWNGPQIGEYLSLDWDGIAYADYDENHIRRLMTHILEFTFQPENIFVCSSPGYSHPDRTLFDAFITGLESKYNTRAIFLPSTPFSAIYPSASWAWRVYHLLEYHILRLMRKGGIY